jgi:hypothetical protein
MWYTGRQSSTWPKWPGHSSTWWHVSHTQLRSSVPIRRSHSPFGLGRPFVKVSANVTSTTESCLSSSGESTPNCTAFTFFTSDCE